MDRDPLRVGLYAPAPDLVDLLPGLGRLREADPAYVKRAEQAQAMARRFAREEILPRVQAIDEACHQDPSYVDWDLWQKANREKYTVGFIPERMGGMGWSALDATAVAEEFSAACVGVSALILFNTFGLLGAMVEFRAGVVLKMIREMVEAQRAGRPLFWSWAITEPGAGTDVEEARAMATMRPSAWADRVEGGYRIQGTKCFITNGSLAHYVVATLPTDRRRPLETMATFLIPAASPGFRVGTVERKCGQKASHTAELFFEEVFVPLENVWEPPGRGLRHTREILSVTRGFIGTVGLGIARGALERCIRYVYQTPFGDGRMIDVPWVQLAVADMLQEVAAVRAACYNFAMALDAFHVMKLFRTPAVRAALAALPERVLLGEPLAALAGNRRVSEAAGRLKQGRVTEDTVERFVKDASAVKVAGTDLAMRVSCRVLDVVGLEGMARKHGMEKCFRDAKAAQIYEGTNQVNRIDIFHREVGRRLESIERGGDRG